MGYKIGLELIVRCKCKKVQEIGIVFRDRVSEITFIKFFIYILILFCKGTWGK